MSRLFTGALLLSVSLVLACGGETPAGSVATDRLAAPPSAMASGDDHGHGHDHSQLDAVTRIAPEDIVDGLAAGTILVLDVRSVRQFEAGHIQDSVSIPVGELDQRAAQLPRDKMIVTYCT